MNAPWLANRIFEDDGTSVFGPLHHPKEGMGPYLEVSVGGVSYYVHYHCQEPFKELPDGRKRKIREWAEKRLAHKLP
jgi:hypothetical protein